MKKTLKRTSLLLAAVMVLALVLVGCAAPATSAPATTTAAASAAPAASASADATKAPAASADATKAPATSAAATGGETVAAIQKAGKLVIGSSPDYAPFEFLVSKDGATTVEGMEIEIMKAVAKEMGVELEIKQLPFDSILMALTAGQVNVGVSGFNITEERQKQVDFSNEFFKEDFAFVVRADEADQFTSKASFDGKKIGVQNGTTQVDAMDKDFASSEKKMLEGANDLLLELKSGKIDAYFTDLSVATVRAAADSGLALAEYVYPATDVSGYAFTFQKGQEDLVEYVNAVIAKLTADGSIDKYFADACALAATVEE